MNDTNTSQGNRKRLVGVVVSNKMEKTVVVSVARKVRHPKYLKYVTQRRKYYVHDEHEECRVGDEVEILETRPLSKMKRWRLLGIKSRAEGT